MINDLISRSALLEKFETLKNNPNNRLHEVVFLDGAMSVIDAAPAVDAVEVVRCKDCKHFLEYSPTYEGEVQGADGDCFIRLRHTEYEPQFCAVQKCEFCNFGERNEVRYE